MITRRTFLQSSLSLALLPLLPRTVSSTTSLHTRLEWHAFRSTYMYGSLLKAVSRMRANTDSADPNSWSYWVRTHKNFCPHRMPYFLAWHRGFLARFEGRLRKVSGDASLVLPYWNYYANPKLPADLTDPSSPLYVSGRVSDDVSAALDLDAFSDTLIRFPRGKPDAFEPVLEAHPHNPVHDLIGGAMSNVSISPRDPVFWLHHANIDRLWAAWVAAGGGRRMPATTNTYWSGAFNYGSAIRPLARSYTYAPSHLGYRYDDTTLPHTLPAMRSAPAADVQSLLPMQAGTASSVLASGGAATLDRRGAALRVPLDDAQRNRLRAALLTPSDGRAQATVSLVLEGVRLTALGERGGFFYRIGVADPDRLGAAGTPSAAIGALGPFMLGAMLQMGMDRDGPGSVRIAFPLDEILRRTWPQPLRQLQLDFATRAGVALPGGALVTIERLHLQIGN